MSRMTSPGGKSEKASSSFWKKSPVSAFPGRPNLQAAASSVAAATASTTISKKSAAGPAGAAGGTTASFRDFEASVSDAWNASADELLPHSHRSVANRANAVTKVHGAAGTAQSAAAAPPAKPALTRTASEDNANNGSKNSSSPAKRRIFTAVSDDSFPLSSSKVEKVERLLVSSESIDCEELRQLSWSGLSPRVRPKAWRILCGYLPGSVLRQKELLQRKQDEYAGYVRQYFATKDQDVHQDTYRQIHIDIPRMSPVIGLFQQRCVQEIFERILYIWAIRHPASGYVQGINDLVTPFFLVFLQEYCADGQAVCELEVGKDLTAEQIMEVEADSFWCLTKVLDGIQDNYTFAQPGIQLKVKQLEELIQRVDKELHDHLVSHEVLYLQFAFRWMNNLLMRELPIKATIRLWDTYLSEEGSSGFARFHLYVCAAFLKEWKAELLKRTDFHTLLMFLQSLPTAKWGDKEINLLVAEAFRLSYLFADAPNHFTTKKAPVVGVP